MPVQQFPQITFGMIVLNGLPFIKYNLKGLYPYAHQIIVVEGACKSASTIADENGHSNDGTLEELKIFKSEFDKEDKITIVTAEDDGKPNGFWNENAEFDNIEWESDAGHIRRSVNFDSRNDKGKPNYTSLIVDAIK